MALKSFLFAVAMLVGSNALCAPPVILTGDGQVCSAPCNLLGMVITTDGTNAVTAVLRDGSVAGAALTPSLTVIGSDYYGGILFPFEINTNRGVYLDVTTSGTTQVAVYVR